MAQFLFHPKVVHLPIAIALLMPLIAGGLAIAWWRGWIQRRAWAVAVVLQSLLLGSGFVAMRSGEAEEERVERVVAERFIEAHEEAAELFMGFSAAVFALFLLAGLVRRERVALSLAAVASVSSVAALGLAYRVGEAGGRLVYQHGAASVYTGSGDTILNSNEGTPEKVQKCADSR